MLQKRIDRGSIPYGLAILGEDVKKGSAVITKVVSGVLKAYLPTTQAEADAVKGFATFRIDSDLLADKDYDILKAGTRVVIYTLVKDNQWATTEVVAGITDGDDLVVGFTDATDKGKLRKRTAGEVTASRKVQFNVYKSYVAGAGYTDAMFEVDVK